MSDHPRRHSLIAALLMCLAVIAVYVPVPEEPGDNALRGGDFHAVHARRMEFARENLSSRGTLPAWYPRELMGAPFRANVQSFPLVPTRLMLYALPPNHAFAAGVMTAAVLAALFTFLYARSLGMTPLGAAASGWTFGCAGSFAAHVAHGALPLLEAYPSLPLLLWLGELNVGRDITTAEPTAVMQPSRWRRGLTLVALGLASTCVALVGHPQLAVYAFVVAGLYLVWRGWRRPRPAAAAALAMVAGVACAGLALYPMLLLAARSTRALSLAPTLSEVVLPYQRLAAWLFPWKDGWAQDVLPLGGRPFVGYPNENYFYETVNYLGWLPIVSVVALLASLIVTRRRPGGRAIFLAVVATAALLTALPLAHDVDGRGITFLRTPARQTYVTNFALALAAGAAIDLLRRLPAARRGDPWPRGLAIALLAVHATDLAWHDRAFIRTIHVRADRTTPLEARLTPLVGDGGRVAIDVEVAAPVNRRIDDIGFFDSVLLAEPYAWFLDLAGAPADHNTQNFNGSILRDDRLQEAGVHVVMTPARRRDLQLLTTSEGIGVYTVPDAMPRATFIPAAAAAAATPDEIHRLRRARAFKPQSGILVPPGFAPPVATTTTMTVPATQPTSAPTTAPATAPTSVAVAVEYRRPNSDEIVVRSQQASDGFVRVLESLDPGWRATLNGQPADVVPADGAFLGVRVPAGDHTVRLTYQTPGAATGILISVVGAIALAAIAFAAPPRRRVTDRPAADTPT